MATKSLRPLKYRLMSDIVEPFMKAISLTGSVRQKDMMSHRRPKLSMRVNH